MKVSEQLDPVQLKEDLENFAKEGGALLVGVADPEAFTAAPEGFRPRDLLPGAYRRHLR